MLAQNDVSSVAMAAHSQMLLVGWYLQLSLQTVALGTFGGDLRDHAVDARLSGGRLLTAVGHLS